MDKTETGLKDFPETWENLPSLIRFAEGSGDAVDRDRVFFESYILCPPTSRTDVSGENPVWQRESRLPQPAKGGYRLFLHLYRAGFRLDIRNYTYEDIPIYRSLIFFTGFDFSAENVPLQGFFSCRKMRRRFRHNPTNADAAVKNRTLSPSNQNVFFEMRAKWLHQCCRIGSVMAQHKKQVLCGNLFYIPNGKIPFGDCIGFIERLCAQKLNQYIASFDKSLFVSGREAFLESAVQEQQHFIQRLKGFCCGRVNCESDT